MIPATTTIESFISAVNRGIEAFEEAGRILVQLVDHDPEAWSRILDNNPGITEDILDTFERIGRKQLYYKLCINETPGVRALRRCAYSEQVKFSAEPIPMLLLDGKDSTDHILVSVYALTSEQAKQVFSTKRIRSLGEQRAYLESMKRLPQPVAVRQAYRITRGKITFLEPCTLTCSEMARLLAEASET